MEIELERTFLAKYLPKDLDKFPSKQMQDNYLPKQARHPILRIRKNGERFTMTKKYPKSQGDTSIMIEETINLAQEEYNALQQINSKIHKKIRYQYQTNISKICEIDIYQDTLKGLVVIDFEFNNIEEKNNFIPPDFCLVEVTQEEFIAGGYLCGKSYEDIQEKLEKFGYKKL